MFLLRGAFGGVFRVGGNIRPSRISGKLARQGECFYFCEFLMSSAWTEHQKYARLRCRALSGGRGKQMTLLPHPIERTNQKKSCWNCKHSTVETMLGTGSWLRFLFLTQH